MSVQSRRNRRAFKRLANAPPAIVAWPAKSIDEIKERMRLGCSESQTQADIGFLLRLATRLRDDRENQNALQAEIRAVDRELDSIFPPEDAIAGSSRRTFRMKAVLDRVQRALDFVYSEVADTPQRKQWVIDQIVRILAGHGYAEWVAEYQRDGFRWDVGEESPS